MTTSTNTTTQREGLMALIKVLRGGQVTLPAASRRTLALKEGDYLEVEEREGELVLKPAAVVDRRAAWARVSEIINRPKWRGPGPEPSEEEVMDTVVDETHAMRREHDQSGSR